MLIPPLEKINEEALIDYDFSYSPFEVTSRICSDGEENQSTNQTTLNIEEGNRKGIEDSFMKYISEMSSFTEETAVFQSIAEPKAPKAHQGLKPHHPLQNVLEPLVRLDYYLKKFKVLVGNYMMKRLNISNIHFYRPKSKEFTAQIKYDLNKKWLDYTVREILLEFDGKDQKNAKSIKKLERNKKIAKNKEDSKRKKDKIYSVLEMRYEELIQDYVSSDGKELLGEMNAQYYSRCSPFAKDLREIKNKTDKKSIEELGNPSSQKYFCNLMKTLKGNISKEKKEIN